MRPAEPKPGKLYGVKSSRQHSDPYLNFYPCTYFFKVENYKALTTSDVGFFELAHTPLLFLKKVLYEESKPKIVLNAHEHLYLDMRLHDLQLSNTMKEFLIFDYWFLYMGTTIAARLPENFFWEAFYDYR